MSTIEYWQIASGSEARDYSDDFVRLGMAFMGKTYWEPMMSIKAGDQVLLKSGMSRLLAVGVVVERDGLAHGNLLQDQDPERRQRLQWLMDFDGWQLPVYCHVQWHRVPQDQQQVRGLTRSTIQCVHVPALRKLADDILAREPAVVPGPLPKPTQMVEVDAMLDFLVQQGLRISDAENLTAALGRIRRLARFYYAAKTFTDEDAFYWADVREHETRTFLVVPLLLALGWSEQQIKVEYPIEGRQRVDLACFCRPFRRNNDECVMLVETKGLSQGLCYAADQCANYAKSFKNCQTLVVTNGICYKSYERRDGMFGKVPSAYLNILEPRDRYPLDPANTAGALEMLRLLLPTSAVQI